MGIILSAITTQFISDLILPDGTTFFASTSTELIAPSGDFTLEEIRSSSDLQSAVDSGDIILTADGDIIFSVSTAGINYISTYGGIINSDIQVNGDISGGTMYSGSTPLDQVINNISQQNSDITRVQPGVNMTTGGTGNFPVVNLSDNITLNSINAVSISGGTVSGGTFYSAGTNVEVIIDDKISDALSTLTPTQFDAFDEIGGTVSVSSTWGVSNVPLTNQRQISTAFTHSIVTNNDEVTIAKGDKYLILGRSSIESSGSNNRSQAECRLEIDTGGGFEEVSGTAAEMYQRQVNYGATGSFFAILDLSIGDKLRVSYRRVTGSAGIELQPGGSALSIIKVASSSGGFLPTFTQGSVIFAGVGGVMTENNSNFFWDDTQRRLKISGDSIDNVVSIGGETDTGDANLYVETNDPGSDIEAFRLYYNRGAGLNGWVSSFYDGAAPTLRLTDEDDDSPYISFNTIGTGTYATPQFDNTFGGRGPVAGATTGFSWKVNGTEKATLDTDMNLTDDGDYRKNGNLFMTGVWASATNSATVTNLYQRRQNGTPSDLSPYVAPFDMTIVAVTTSSNSSQTWDAEVRKAPANSTTFSNIHTLSVSSSFQGSSTGLTINVDAGERVAMFIAGTTITYPNIDIYWKSR